MIGLFIRVPKNASTSLINAFNKNCYLIKVNSLNNLETAFVKNKNGILYSKTQYRSRLIHQYSKKIKLNKVFSFGFVRNPYARAVSSFKLHSNEKLVNEWRSGKVRKNFKQYLKILEKQNLNPSYEFMSPEFLMACQQYPFLIDDHHSVKVNFIGKVENIQNDINIVTKKLNLKKIIIPHLNKTNVKNYVEYYDDECKDIVAKIYKKDIEYFNYQFEEK